MQLNFVQSARGQVRLFLCLLTASAWIAPAQTAKDEGTEIATLRAEVQRLALELLQHRAEFIQWKMQWLRAELEQVQAERQRLTSERLVIEREIGELSQALPNGAAAENEDRKEELKTVQGPALLADERAAATREAALAAALSAENKQIAEIEKQTQRLIQPPKQR